MSVFHAKIFEKIFWFILISKRSVSPERALSCETIEIIENASSLKSRMCYKDKCDMT